VHGQNLLEVFDFDNHSAADYQVEPICVSYDQLIERDVDVRL
jgi:hypothetical protein